MLCPQGRLLPKARDCQALRCAVFLTYATTLRWGHGLYDLCSVPKAACPKARSPRPVCSVPKAVPPPRPVPFMLNVTQNTKHYPGDDPIIL